MDLDFMTPDVWDGLVLGVIIVGLALAVLRLYVDLSRRPDGERTPPPPEPPRAPTRSRKPRQSPGRRR